MEDNAMERNNRFSNPKSMLILVACICFAIAVLETAGLDQPGPVVRLPLVHRLISPGKTVLARSKSQDQP
jgi:hypothetical protein